ncbi:MAG: glycoside hydrolase family 32 protein [Firmicutes bacterium]|nr:glycoside hydrolase family 32 protein [Bacillota bacterium]
MPDPKLCRPLRKAKGRGRGEIAYVFAVSLAMTRSVAAQRKAPMRKALAGLCASCSQIARYAILSLLIAAQLLCAVACGGKLLLESEIGYEESEMLKEANEYIEANQGTVNGRFRGDYHLQPQIGWMNDPNGFVYYKGNYHLFYQFHPYSADGGLMYWGHAVSEDLVSWKYLPVALAPDRDYDADGCWSGSAIVEGDRLYLVYTGHYDRNGKRVQTQNLAYSDDGIHFFKYEGNPIIGPAQLPEGTSAADFRDPYIWKREGKYYILIGTMEEGAAKVQLYQSDDLFHWSYANDFLRRTHAGYCWECPSLVTLKETDLFVCAPVDYPHGEYAFWNYNSNVYATGKVDYKTGKMQASAFSEIDAGLDFYAAQLIRGKDEKIVMIAWMNMWNRKNVTSWLGDGWAGTQILPREVSLREGKLVQKPAEAIYGYCKNTVRIEDSLEGSRSYENVEGRSVRLKISTDLKEAESFTVSVFVGRDCHTDISYEKSTQTVKFDRSKSGYPITADERDMSEGRYRLAKYPLENGVLEMEIFLDKSSVEIFFGKGELTMTSLSYNAETASGIVFSCEGKTLVNMEKSDIVL